MSCHEILSSTGLLILIKTCTNQLTENEALWSEGDYSYDFLHLFDAHQTLVWVKDSLVKKKMNKKQQKQKQKIPHLFKTVIVPVYQPTIG